MRSFLGSMMFDVKLWVLHPVSYIAYCDRIFVETTFVGDLQKISEKKHQRLLVQQKLVGKIFLMVYLIGGLDS